MFNRPLFCIILDHLLVKSSENCHSHSRKRGSFFTHEQLCCIKSDQEDSPKGLQAADTRHQTAANAAVYTALFLQTYFLLGVQGDPSIL